MQTRLISRLTLLSVAALTVTASFAQDTTRRKTVNITSTFKPVLKDAAKINFNAAPPVTDTSRPRLQYNIPDQNLLFAYQPGMLRPLALQIDTAGRWKNESYVKAGYGMLRTPYLEAGLSFGDGKTKGVNVYAQHVSSHGKIPYQDFANTTLEGNAFYQTGKNLEWDGRFGIVQEKYNKYGFRPDSLKFSDDSLAVKFQTVRGRLSFHNISPTQFGLSYAPEIKVDIFNDQINNSESNTYVYLPLKKTIGRVFEFDVSATADLTRYKPQKAPVVDNTFYAIAPSFLFKTPNAFVQAGINPSWDNGAFKLFPNIMAEVGTSDKRISFQVGFIGYLRKTSYQYLASLNPWIWAPMNLNNTQIIERYAGVKGSAGDHLNYSAKIGFNTYYNQPLFVNDTMSGKSFLVVNEPHMNAVHLGGEVGYTIGEKFSWINNLSINQYTSLKANDKAYGLLPVEFKSIVRIQVMKDLYLKADLYGFSGTWYRNKSGSSDQLPGAVDLGAGAEFNITKNLKLWTQFNNILNNQYQRWNQYPVYGFNLMGGVVFSFAQNNSSTAQNNK